MKAFLINMRAFAVIACLISPWTAASLRAQAPPDQAWIANADLEAVHKWSLPGLGAAQGVSIHEGKVYLYGDVWDAKPRVGVIREYAMDFTPTGRCIWLRKDGKPLLVHPTGLTWNSVLGTFLGDTVNRKAIIYRLDWERALKDGDLTNAVLDVIDDDAAVNGCRPEFVTLGGQDYLATADYGDARPEIRLYDPEKMLQAKRTSAPGVVTHRVLAGPYNQNLHWDARTGQLTCIQNVIAGRGWQLEAVDLQKATADGRAWGPGVQIRKQTFLPHDELEGYRPLDSSRGLFVTSSRANNLVVGEPKTIPVQQTPPGRP